VSSTQFDKAHAPPFGDGYLRCPGCKNLPLFAPLQGILRTAATVFSKRLSKPVATWKILRAGGCLHFAEPLKDDDLNESASVMNQQGERCNGHKERVTMEFVRKLWSEQEGQDIAEYAVMLAVILVIVVGTIRLIGSNANNVFSNVASSLQ
jgi:Flp pilus assembly pilin Flp